jgi:MerR family copper efflux transcriptional regulator
MNQATGRGRWMRTHIPMFGSRSMAIAPPHQAEEDTSANNETYTSSIINRIQLLAAYSYHGRKVERAMQIGELAKQSGLNPKTIRYYEDIGLLPRPSRTASGYRRYDETAISQLEFIQRAKLLGFSLDEIREVFAIHERGETPCDRVLASIDAELAHLDERIRELQRLRDQLKTLRGQWSDEARHRADMTCLCPIIEEQTAVAARPKVSRTLDVRRRTSRFTATG